MNDNAGVTPSRSSSGGSSGRGKAARQHPRRRQPSRGAKRLRRTSTSPRQLSERELAVVEAHSLAAEIDERAREHAVRLIQRAFRRYYKHRYDSFLANAQDVDPITLEPVYTIPRANLSVWTAVTRLGDGDEGYDFAVEADSDEAEDIVEPRPPPVGSDTDSRRTRSTTGTELRGFAATELALALLCNSGASPNMHPGLQIRLGVLEQLVAFEGVLTRQCLSECPRHLNPKQPLVRRRAAAAASGAAALRSEPLHLFKTLERVKAIYQIASRRFSFIFKPAVRGGARYLKALDVAAHIQKSILEKVDECAMREAAKETIKKNVAKRRRLEYCLDSRNRQKIFIMIQAHAMHVQCEKLNMFDLAAEQGQVLNILRRRLAETGASVFDFGDSLPPYAGYAPAIELAEKYNAVTQ